ncbi:glycosyltransferase family 4 protein [Cellulophaga sp. Hel_I_12]|uniref:glycosyltransferase family 4 protein n=1 Tax=Cellulophaga sp. Hel_I_12 TaxID=1249972 RepID=UPI0006457809|nr:glycosyltransferase family 4 protein [Cellulophaga sp. Hel_I_12]
MKILYITNGVSGPGGLERVLSIKASYLADAMNYDIHFLTLNKLSDELFYTFSDAITFHNIIATGNPIQYILKYRNEIKKIIAKIQPDVITVCDDGLKGLFLPLMINKPCPMIYERHVSKNIAIQKDQLSAIQKSTSWLLFKLMDFGANFYDRFVVLTNGNKKEWKLNNIAVIPNPLSFYPPEEEISTVTNKKVLAVGKQSFQKGYDRLLQSWKIVQDTHPDWELDIYGTISEKEALPELAKALGIENSVHFYAPVKNIASKYKEASIYVMSSRYEGFGMVLTEAMAYGVPCVSFDCPYGPSDIIQQNHDGILVPNHNTSTLANAMLSLMNDAQWRTKMGATARANVKRYLIEEIAIQWDNLFKSLI